LLANHYDKTRSLDLEVMIQQMAKEFTFPELKAAMIEMQTLQFRDQFSRPPMLATLDPRLWAFYLKSMPVDTNMRIV